MTNLTEMQFALMNRIAHDQYNSSNGQTPEEASDVNCWLWADEFASDIGLTEKQVGGLLTTLQEADLIGINKVKRSRTLRGGEPDESTVWFTEAGFQAWKNGGAVTKTSTKKAAKKEVAVEADLIDLLASREGSHKRAAAKVLLKGKPMTMAALAKAVYGEAEFISQVGMVLKGIAKAIEVHGLKLTLTKEEGKVALK